MEVQSKLNNVLHWTVLCMEQSLPVINGGIASGAVLLIEWGNNWVEVESGGAGIAVVCFSHKHQVTIVAQLKKMQTSSNRCQNNAFRTVLIQ